MKAIVTSLFVLLSVGFTEAVSLDAHLEALEQKVKVLELEQKVKGMEQGVQEQSFQQHCITVSNRCKSDTEYKNRFLATACNNHWCQAFRQCCGE